MAVAAYPIIVISFVFFLRPRVMLLGLAPGRQAASAARPPGPAHAGAFANAGFEND